MEGEHSELRDDLGMSGRGQKRAGLALMRSTVHDVEKTLAGEKEILLACRSLAEEGRHVEKHLAEKAASGLVESLAAVEGVLSPVRNREELVVEIKYSLAAMESQAAEAENLAEKYSLQAEGVMGDVDRMEAVETEVVADTRD